jgi:protein-tyrosine phosphatase
MCRSPVAEAFLKAKVEAAGLTDVRVHSAGLLESGRAAPYENIEVMAALGYDIDPHRSRQISVEMIEASDLIIGMAREHVREVAVEVPDAWPRTFTLREVVRRGEDVGPRGPAQPLDEWIAKVHAGRAPAMLVGTSDVDDVADPMGRSRRDYETAANEIDELTARLYDLVWGEQS